ncbi:NAC domain-containing protein 76-like [Silene latifolia]|uniref:NAC domain-containing protein 76-like n=1 Tax=Silene latifolia TaxID=37657 RepID=UPI003D7880E1
MEGWDSSYHVYNENNGVNSMVDPIFVPRHSQTTSFFTKNNNNLLCKQELESEALANFMRSTSLVDNFLQLPQLESPPQLPSLTRVSLSFVSLVSQNTNNYHSNPNKVTDWRDLDKFVASQLSHHQDPNELLGNQGNNDHRNRGHGKGVASSFNYDHEESCSTDIEAILMMHMEVLEEENMS